MGYELQSLERAINLLDTLGRTRSMRLGELAVQVDCSPATALRTLRVLERHGLVRRSHDGTNYMLGARLTELGQLAATNIGLTTALRPVATGLADRFECAAHVGLFRGDAITIVDKIDSVHSAVRYSTLGTQMSLNASAGGKAVLAALGMEAAVERISSLTLHATTEHSIVDAEALLADLVQARDRGYAMEAEEHRTGFACVACALRHDGELYSISLSGPVVERAVLQERGEALRAELIRAAELLAGVTLAF
ncbi:IclR family transcriptional regulator [Streptomyces sp. NPDC005055]